MEVSNGEADWMRPLIPNHDSLLEAGCFEEADSWTEPICTYDLSFVVLGLVTGIISVYALVVVFKQLRTVLALRMLIIATNLCVCVLVVLHYSLFSGWRIAIGLRSLVLIQYLQICYFFWRVLIRMGTVQPGYSKYFNFTILGFLVAEIALDIYVMAQGTIGCNSIPWLVLATFQLFLAVFYLVAVRCMLKRMKIMKYTEMNIGEYQRKKKKQLWCLLIINIFSSMAGVAYELVNVISIADSTQCEMYFEQATQTVNLLIRGLVRTVYIFLPVWGAMVVFWHWPHGGGVRNSLSDTLTQGLTPDDEPWKPPNDLRLPGPMRTHSSDSWSSTGDWDHDDVGTSNDIWAFRLPVPQEESPLRTPIKMVKRSMLPSVQERLVL